MICEFFGEEKVPSLGGSEKTFSGLNEKKIRFDIEKVLEKVQTNWIKKKWKKFYLKEERWKEVKPVQLSVEGFALYPFGQQKKEPGYSF